MHSVPFSSGGKQGGGTVLTFSRPVIFPVISEYGMNWESILGGSLSEVMGNIKSLYLYTVPVATRCTRTNTCEHAVHCQLGSRLRTRKTDGRDLQVSESLNHSLTLSL